MLTIFIKRVLMAIPVLLAVASLTFFLVKLAPGGPFDADKAVSPQVLKNLNEAYNLNASFLHGMFFENISDLQSQLQMDTLAYMRLERDFGSFDAWQKDFIACAMSSRNGWVLTVYNMHLNRYINVVVDLHSQNVPIASYPVVVLDCWEHSYYRDYLRDRKTYVHAMMKELDWEIIEARFKKADKIAKVMAG